MKKISLIIGIILVIFITGCEKNSVENGEWVINTEPIPVSIPSDAKESFDKAITSFTGIALEPIALLGTQVVSGTNYLFLCKATTVTGEIKNLWELVIVYADLNGNNTITNVISFKDTDYLDKNIKKTKNDNLTGGFEVYLGNYANNIPSSVSQLFDKLLKSDDNTKYNPVTLLWSNNNEYAVLTIENDIKNDTNYIVIYTLSNKKITNKAYINLTDIL